MAAFTVSVARTSFQSAQQTQYKRDVINNRAEWTSHDTPCCHEMRTEADRTYKQQTKRPTLQIRRRAQKAPTITLMETWMDEDDRHVVWLAKPNTITVRFVLGNAHDLLRTPRHADALIRIHPFIQIGLSTYKRCWEGRFEPSPVKRRRLDGEKSAMSSNGALPLHKLFGKSGIGRVYLDIAVPAIPTESKLEEPEASISQHAQPTKSSPPNKVTEVGPKKELHPAEESDSNMVISMNSSPDLDTSRNESSDSRESIPDLGRLAIAECELLSSGGSSPDSEKLVDKTSTDSDLRDRPRYHIIKGTEDEKKCRKREEIDDSYAR
ncbi:hypothetical protein TELCIR_00269 [Teladorsagia circumcincta]|uniref:Uncharacterized protein n=1 Tax=Teladorsagia circumcincta TaxID=45464 RepID=A0A2G9V5D0_TELCI|nr:hypothetical protein TELCIR_00269 [Teladorsagia circumcincta]